MSFASGSAEVKPLQRTMASNTIIRTYTTWFLLAVLHPTVPDGSPPRNFWRSANLRSASFIELETGRSVGRTLTPAPQFWSYSKKAPGWRSPSGRLLSPLRIPSPFDLDI
jgi:hypothetical protein